MALKSIISLTALLAVVGCGEEETKLSPPPPATEHVSSSASQQPLHSITSDRPKCEEKWYPSQTIEQALDALYTNAGRAVAIQKMLDKWKFPAWVELTGGPTRGCQIPFPQERIVLAIDYFVGMNRLDEAFNVTEHAGYLTRDWQTFNLRATALQGARNAALSPEERIHWYEEASKSNNHSFAENLPLAEEVVRYFVSERVSWKGESIVERLLPNSADYKQDNEQVVKLEIPPEIGARKQELLKRLTSIPRGSPPDSRRPTRTTTAKESRCQAHFRNAEEGKIRSASYYNSNDSDCTGAEQLKFYEAVGDFERARGLATSLGLEAKATAYAVLSGVTHIEYGHSVEYGHNVY